ncbi:MAG: hypothetical protein J1E16_04805 [Muribaculaceae bacterium]|nr:hypothetical protein [Muribaculaceae bacterium]
MIISYSNICEDSFSLEVDGSWNYCAVDSLRKTQDGLAIYEVKSSTYKSEEKDTPGGDAMTQYPAIAKMAPAEAEATRTALLEYCKLDTYAIVKIWQKLKELTDL